MAHLYANENFPYQVVAALRTLGHNVLTVQEADNAEQAISYEAVLAFATQHHRAVITLNRRDFIRLHAAHPDHAGIIVCTQDADTDGQAERIHHAINTINTLAGQLLRVNRPQQ